MIHKRKKIEKLNMRRGGEAKNRTAPTHPGSLKKKKRGRGQRGKHVEGR